MLKFGDGQNFVSTSHSEFGDPSTNAILFDPSLNLASKDLTEYDHSHPGGIHYPSGRPLEGENSRNCCDIGVAERTNKQFPGSNIKYNIYTPSDGQFTPYTTDSKRPGLPVLIITAPIKKKN